MDFLSEISPIEYHNGIYIKRNDKLKIYDCNGGKSQGAYFLIKDAMKKGFAGVATVGSRFSPQCDIVSDICENEGIQCRLFMPKAKEETDIIKKIKTRKNSVINQIPYGYTSNLIYNAQNFCKLNNFYFIPFGMKCLENINVVARQCENIPANIKRIVVPVGSGVTLCGVLTGLMNFERYDIEVLGIQTGADSTKFIYRHLPLMNEIKFNLKFYKPELKPAKRYSETVYAEIDGIVLNERYEAKCYSFINKNDLLWIVGK